MYNFLSAISSFLDVITRSADKYAYEMKAVHPGRVRFFQHVQSSDKRLSRFHAGKSGGYADRIACGLNRPNILDTIAWRLCLLSGRLCLFIRAIVSFKQAIVSFYLGNCVF